MDTLTPIPRLVTQGLSWKEYLATPRELGWIYEYSDGTMYVRTCSAVVPLILIRRDLKASPQLPAGMTVRPVTDDDEAALRRAFEAAFWQTADFPEFPRRAFRKLAREDIRNHLEGTRGAPLDASRLAEADGQVVGAVLLREFSLGTLLNLVFTDPAVQRRGLAGALLARAVDALPEDVGHVFSSVRLANAPSLAWHRRWGFLEVPNLQVLRMRAQHFGEELRRHRELGHASEEELTRLDREAEYWIGRCKALRESVGDDYDGLHPYYW